MTFGDDSPPPHPSAEQQGDALRKGLGRAAQWAAAGRLDEGLLLAACRTDQRHDQDIDGVRGGWLWGMVRAAGAAGRLRVPLLHALRELADGRSADQLCGLARGYAEAGDGEFRARLDAIVEHKLVADRPWLGEGEIVALDGEKGFLFAAGVRGRTLARDATAWDDGSLVRLGVERFGANRVGELLAASADEGVRRLRENWLRAEARLAAPGPVVLYQDAVRATTVGEVLRQATGAGRVHGFRTWGTHAGPADLAVVLGHLWAAREPKLLANLLAVFSARALPEFDARLVELCRHADDGVRQAALAALGENAHPLVRKFALAELDQGPSDAPPVGLLVHNYERGDERRVLDALTLPTDDNDLHWVLRDIVTFLDKCPEADASHLGVIAYAATPCGDCRGYAARVLSDRGVAPDWLREECRHDADDSCRQLFARTSLPLR